MADSIADQLDIADSNDTQCLIISWTVDGKGTSLTYMARPCMEEYTSAVCEVRVYTQTWYVWATTNWLQVGKMKTSATSQCPCRSCSSSPWCC